MPILQLANGTAINDVLEWDGAKWVSRIVKVRTDNGWEDCFRPSQFSDTGLVINGAIRRSTTAGVNDGLYFNKLVDFDLWQINDNLTTFVNPSTWGNAAIRAIGDYYEVSSGTSTASFGIVTDRGIGLNLLQNQEYTVSFEMKSQVLQTLNYNYVISNSGNIKISNLTVNKPKDWTKFSITFISADKERLNAGVLIGADLRSDSLGNVFYIRNVKIEVGNRAT